MFAKYFEYYTIILRGAFFRGHAVKENKRDDFFLNTVYSSPSYYSLLLLMAVVSSKLVLDSSSATLVTSSFVGKHDRQLSKGLRIHLQWAFYGCCFKPTNQRLADQPRQRLRFLDTCRFVI